MAGTDPTPDPDPAPAPAAELPPARTRGRYLIAMVCLGNICRSPVAAAVLRQRLSDAGLEDTVEVVSSGTGDWHVGGEMDPRAAETLSAAGYDTRHTAQQITPDWLEDCDLLLVMDESNLHEVVTLGEAEDGRLHKFRDFDPVGTGGDVPDPYFGGADGFTRVLGMVERTCDELVLLLEGRSRTN